MKKRKLFALVVAMNLALVSVLSGCSADNAASTAYEGEDSEESTEEETQEETQENTEESEDASVTTGSETGRFQIGETAVLKGENSDGEYMEESITLTETEYVSAQDSALREAYVLATFDIENTGDATLVVGSTYFEAYADDYEVEVVGDDTSDISASLSKGRKAKLKCRIIVDPYTVNTIELEYHDAIFVIQDSSAENTDNTEDLGEASAYLGEYQVIYDANDKLGLYATDDGLLHVICTYSGETYYETTYFDWGVVDGTLYAHSKGVAEDDEYVLSDSGTLDVLIDGSAHYQTYTKIGDDSAVSDGDDEEWNLGEFSEDWYKSTPNFADTNGNTLEIIYLDGGELDFAINGETMYYGMASEHTDYGDGVYIYTLNDGSGNEVSMLYYPTDTVQIDNMVFTVVQ
jgi:hypothetical protein